MRIMILPALIVGSLLPVLTAPLSRPAPPVSADQNAAWEKFGRAERPDKGYVSDLDDAMRDFLWERAHARRRFADAIGEVAQHYNIKRETAADLIEATIATHTLPEMSERTVPLTAEHVAIAAALWRAYQREPAADIVLRQAAWILSQFEMDDHAQVRHALDELTISSDPVPLANRIAWLGLGDYDVRRAAIATAMEHRPNDPVILLNASQLHDDEPCASAAFARAALEAASAAKVRDAQLVATARNRWLGGLLGAGLNREAIDAFSTIPAAEQEAALAADDHRVHGSAGGLDYEADVMRLRSATAAAAFLVDERELAARIARTPKGAPAAKPDVRAGEPERLDLVRRAIARLSDDAGDDPFDLLDRAIVESDSMGSIPPLSTALLFVRLARQAGYEEIAAALLDPYRRRQRDSAAPPQGMTAEIEACRVRVARVLDDSAVAPSATAENSTTADPAAAVIARLLAAKPKSVYTEHPLPPHVTPWDPPDAERKKLEADLEERKIAGLWCVRVEQEGKNAIAIGLSQDYDPAGEVSGGGYWIVRSHDGGNTWDRPLYTGLRPMQPYVIRSFSHLPLAAGDHLHIEVDVRELDTGKIMFPPIESSFTREQSGLYLDVAWSDLEKDSDGDGLTDLAEERLMTDPLSADTDGDHLTDKVDPLPQIPAVRQSSAETDALSAVLEHATSVHGAPIFGTDPGGQGPATASLDNFDRHALALTSEETIFLVADRRVFAGIALDHRIIVLTHDELERASERFGPFYPGSLRFFINHAGTKALAIWNESWRGSTIRLRLENGVWKCTTVSEWIT